MDMPKDAIVALKDAPHVMKRYIPFMVQIHDNGFVGREPAIGYHSCWDCGLQKLFRDFWGDRLLLFCIEVGCGDCCFCSACKPCDILEAKAKKIVLETPLECDLCGKCRDVCNLRQLAIEYSKDDFLFMIESHGALENADIIEKAVQILEEKNSDFRKEIKKL